VRFANAFLSYATYVGKLFWPSNLAVIYPFIAADVSFWLAIIAALLLLTITVFVIRLSKNQKYLAVGWFWFLGTLIPVIGLIQSGGQAERDLPWPTVRTERARPSVLQPARFSSASRRT
jgi:hypothetical protein